MSPEIKQAWGLLADITDLLGEVNQWTNDKAYVATKALYGKWYELCSKTKTARSKKFIDQCTKLLDECGSFCAEIVKKAKSVAVYIKNKISLIVELAGDSKETKSLLKETLKLWNKIEQPQLVFFFEKTTELQSSIMDMMEFAVQPIEAITN